MSILKTRARQQHQDTFSLMAQYPLYLTDTSINPKRCGLFGLLDMRGGLIQPILRKRSLTPPNFILEQQTGSHMKAEVFS